MKENIFREYDIRGIVGSEMPIENIQHLTKAILTYFLQQKPDLKTIVVGRDGRTHAPYIKAEVIKAAHDMGISVVDIGTCPTPIFYFSLFNKTCLNGTRVNGETASVRDTASGLMITASHNPKEYNGIKICLDKKSVWGTQIQEIKQIYYKGTFHEPKEGNVPTLKTYDAITAYIDWTKKHFAHLQGSAVNAVIDCGNGSAGTVIPRLVKEMDLKNVTLLYEEVDGLFPNHEADPTKEKNMLDVKALLQKETYSVGLGLDGDCDRMNPMTPTGYLVPGDQLLALYSHEILQQHPGASIVFDIKSSDALIQELKNIGAKPCIAPSGHSIIKEHLRMNNAKLAGELSCHFFFNDRYFGYDDGIYAALRLFELLQASDKTLDERIEALPQRVSSPEYRITCAEQDKKHIVERVKTAFAAKPAYRMLTIDGIRAQSDKGWGLLRASNTQPAVCLRFESDTEQGLKQIKQDFITALDGHLNTTELSG